MVNSLAYESSTDFDIYSCCEECGITVLQADYDALRLAKKQARYIKDNPHLFNWDIIAALSIQEDVLAHLLESFSAFLRGGPDKWARLSHKQRIHAIKQDIRRVRSKCLHKTWQGERSLDRLVFEVRKSGGRVSVAYATAFLGFKTMNGHGVRKLVKRSNGRLTIVDGFVVLSVTPTLPLNQHVTMHQRHDTSVSHTKSVTSDSRLNSSRRPSHTTYLKPYVTIQTHEPKTARLRLLSGGRKEHVATTEELMAMLHRPCR